jgi:tripartite-type tricarboxylate transporter receptor subunit TctC
VPANTLKELIDLAKSKPGQLNYASVGNGTPHHIAGETFKIAAGVDMVHVPYKTGAHIGLLSNNVQVMFEGLGPFLQHIRAGKVKALAVAGPKRFGQIPDVPTTAEAGLPGYEVSPHMGLVAPKATPSDVIRAVNAVVVKAMSAKEVLDLFFNQGVVPASSSPEQYAAIIRDDVGRWLRASKAAKAKLD